MIEKTEQEGEKQEEVKEGDFSFSFAKVWAADKDAMEDIQEDDQVDSWTQTLQKIMVEREKSQMQETTASGRGVRRAAASYKVRTHVSVNFGYCLISSRSQIMWLIPMDHQEITRKN